MNPSDANNVRQSMISAGMMALASLGGGRYLSMPPGRSEPEIRPCVNCGKPKQHNNAFCSAECCKQYRANKRQ